MSFVWLLATRATSRPSSRLSRACRAICQDKLSHFAIVVVFAIADLSRLGIDVVGTFRTPHVTLAGKDVETLVESLTRCPYESRNNPHHE